MDTFSVVKATLQHKLEESFQSYKYYSDQLEHFEHSQGINNNIKLSSLSSTNLETLFFSAIVNSSLIANTTNLALSSHNLYNAYLSFYRPFFCTPVVDYRPHTKNKAPLVFYVANSISRINAVLTKLLLEPRPLMHHTTFGRTVHRLLKTKAEPPRFVRKHDLIQLCIEDLKSQLVEIRCFDEYVKLSQPLNICKVPPLVKQKKPKIKKSAPEALNNYYYHDLYDRPMLPYYQPNPQYLIPNGHTHNSITQFNNGLLCPNRHP